LTASDQLRIEFKVCMVYDYIIVRKNQLDWLNHFAADPVTLSVPHFSDCGKNESAKVFSGVLLSYH